MDSEEREAFEREWAALSEEVLSGMRDWRVQHPHATLSEIEVDLDGRLARMRARMLERVAQQSAATSWRQAANGREDTAAPCPQCGTPLKPHGCRTRRLRTVGGQQVQLEREYGVCPQCGQGLFPSGGKSGIGDAESRAREGVRAERSRGVSGSGGTAWPWRRAR